MITPHCHWLLCVICHHTRQHTVFFWIAIRHTCQLIGPILASGWIKFYFFSFYFRHLSWCFYKYVSALCLFLFSKVHTYCFKLKMITPFLANDYSLQLFWLGRLIRIDFLQLYFCLTAIEYQLFQPGQHEYAHLLGNFL